MYILEVRTEEYYRTEEGVKKRFEELKKRILSHNTCITDLYVYDNRTGEILNEYNTRANDLYNN